MIIREVFCNDYTWAVVLKETNEPIGCMGYFPFGKSNIDIGENDAEIGYWIGKPHWNKGYCTEALQVMIRYCYEKKNFQTLWSDFFIDNPASGRVMEKCGFTDTGKENYCSNLYHGEDRPVHIMILEKKQVPPERTRKIKSRTTIEPHEGIPTSLMWLLTVMAGVSVANLYYCQPLLNMIREDLHLTEFEVNLMPVFTQVGYALGLLFIIPMGDMYNRRKTMMTCAMVLTCSLLCISFTSCVWLLLAASFVTGFFSVIPQMFMPFASLYSRPEEKERRVGMILSGLLTGILGSRVASGYIGHLMGWRSMYIIAAFVLLAMACMVYAYFPNVAPTYKGKFSRLLMSIRTLAREHPRSLLYSVRSGFAFGSFLGLWGCLAFRMKEAPFFASSDVVGMLSICGIAGALTASNVGKFIPRFGVERIHAVGIGLQLVAWAMLGVTHNTYAGIILSIIIIDIGMQCIQLSNQSATMKLCPEASSRMNTIYMFSYFIGGSIGTFLAGTLWSLYGWTGTVAAGILMLAGSIISAIVLRFKS